MSHNSLFSSDAKKSAYIRDNALILYFETAETPLVARFDLDSLVQANFEVTKKDELFVLVLRDFSGQRQEITAFANKADAHQALYAILQALLSYGEGKKTNGNKPNLVWKFIKGLLIGIALIVIVAVALLWFSTPVSHTTVPDAVSQKAAAEIPNEVPSVPEGEPMDMEQLIAPSALQEPSVDASQAMTPAEPSAEQPATPESAPVTE